VGVEAGVNVTVAVGVELGVGEHVAVVLAVGVLVPVAVAVAVLVPVAVAVGIGAELDPPHPASTSRNQTLLQQARGCGGIKNAAGR
jgi:hypothetical protein